jgi:hypothetical protein
VPQNHVQELQASLIAQFPVRIPVPVLIKMDPPDEPHGFWWLDVFAAGRHVAIEWRPRKPHRQDVFGVSLVREGAGIGEVSEEWLSLSLSATVERVIELLCEGKVLDAR